MRARLRRNRVTKSVSSTGTQILGPNESRWAVMLMPPSQLDPLRSSASVVAHAADTSTLGSKLSLSPGGFGAAVGSATFFEISGTTVVAQLQMTRSGVTVVLAQFTGGGTWTGQVFLGGSDTLAWVVTTNIAATTADFAINADSPRQTDRVTVDFGDTAVIDNGIQLYQGGTPVYLRHEDIGDSLREAMTGVASSGSFTITAIDFFV